jgi:DNA-binding beta-propeller fold protein YncE
VVSDGKGKVYANIEDKSEVAVIDIKAAAVVARWSVAPGDSPSGLAIDPVARRLFIACGNQKMVVMDADSGKILGSETVGSGVDGAAYDAAAGLVFIPNGRDGTLTIIRPKPGAAWQADVTTVPTARGARCVCVDEATHRCYLPCGVDGALALLVVGPKG